MWVLSTRHFPVPCTAGREGRQDATSPAPQSQGCRICPLCCSTHRAPLADGGAGRSHPARVCRGGERFPSRMPGFSTPPQASQQPLGHASVSLSERPVEGSRDTHGGELGWGLPCTKSPAESKGDKQVGLGLPPHDNLSLGSLVWAIGTPGVAGQLLGWATPAGHQCHQGYGTPDPTGALLQLLPYQGADREAPAAGRSRPPSCPHPALPLPPGAALLYPCCPSQHALGPGLQL